MTEEQIQQNALKAEKEHGNFNYQYQGEAFNKGYIAGAHSRNEEIEELKERLKFAVESIADADKWIAKYKLEIDKLRNPWISVKDRLPETGADIIYLMNSGTPGRNERYRKFDAEWFRMNVRHWQYANVPELKKGE